MEVSKLKAGDAHYMAYVGPPAEYDFMGATQFRLLCTLGLRANHYLLDFGCGSLRAGRLFISYLDKGRYFGIEPNKWLIEEAIDKQIGKDVLRIKEPQFDYNSDFTTGNFSVQFDFILAQSIFTHAGGDLIIAALKNFTDSLKPDGLIAATFAVGNHDFDGSGWVYPTCVNYSDSAIELFGKKAGLFAQKIPWYNPRITTWYIFSKNAKRLPNEAMMPYLRGPVVLDPEFADSWSKSARAAKKFTYYRKKISRPFRKVRKYIKRIIWEFLGLSINRKKD